MPNLEAFAIDYIETDGKLTWVKSRGAEFYVREGKWYRRMQNLCDAYDFVGYEHPLDDVRVFDGGHRLVFEEYGTLMLWRDDGYTMMEDLQFGVIGALAPEDVQRRWGIS